LFLLFFLHPIPASCTPNTLSYCCGFGITNVTFNTINKTSNPGSDGYSDFTNVQTTVLEGQSYLLSIQTTASSTQNYAAWIDFNNDGIFNDVSERVFTATSQYNTSGNIIIPTGAVLNTQLRMRISADYDFSAAPTPCADLDYGQAEDYTIIITQNTNPPTPIFSADNTTTCTGSVCFTDQSLNVPTSWLWNFGDGTSSNQQNPCHTYSADGPYTITLTASNANGSNTDSIVNYITVNTAGFVMAASCSPSTLSYCCGYGITNVQFNTINNTSPDGIEGYQDFSCTKKTTVTEGNPYPIAITSNTSNPQDIRVWIDYNNDGSFNNTNELVANLLNTTNPTTNLNIATGATTNTALRMRISADVVGTPQNACDNNSFGQTEDYGITILPNSLPPTANFSASPTQTCSDSVYFTDLSTNGATSWLWNFGDGNTSNLQNPAHFYTTPGNYTVKLTVMNAFGQDIKILTNYITIDCSNIFIPQSGVQTIVACSGNLYDDGGPGNNYSDITDGSIVLQTSGTSVKLTFNYFLLDQNNPGDTVFVYDGPSSASPVLAVLTSFSNPNTIISSGGSMTVRQKTDFFGNDVGFDATWSCTLSVKDISLGNKILIYPNPASAKIHIENLNENNNFESLVLLNFLGEKVYSEKINQTQNMVLLDVSTYVKGIYLLQIKTKEGVVVKKINIQ